MLVRIYFITFANRTLSRKKRFFIQPNDWTSLNINSSIPFCHFQLFSRVHFMHGAHRLVNIWYTLSVFFIIVAVSLIFQDFFPHFIYIQFYNFTIFPHPIFICSISAVRNTCGKEAAHFTRNILDRISFSLMRVSCDVCLFVFIYRSTEWNLFRIIQFLMRLSTNCQKTDCCYPTKTNWMQWNWIYGFDAIIYW